MKLEMIVYYHMDAENWTQVLCQDTSAFQLLSHLASIGIEHFNNSVLKKSKQIEHKTSIIHLKTQNLSTSPEMLFIVFHRDKA